MGAVYRVLAPEGDEVALKVLLGARNATPQQRKRFEREVRALAQVSHPNVVRLRDSGHYRGSPYVVLDLHAGGTLQDRLSTGGPLPVEEAVRYGRQLAAGLIAIHELQLLHRDLKPDNVLLDGSGGAALTDFGLVKDLERVGQTQQLTLSGAAHGTPGYWSPEQAAGSKEVGPATDIYGLGAILYAALSGEAPISGVTLREVQLATLRQIPNSIRAQRSDVSVELEAIVLRCLEKEPEARWPSAAELAEALGNLGSSQGGADSGRGPWLGRVIALCLIALALGLGGLGVWSRFQLSGAEKVERGRKLLEAGETSTAIGLLEEAAAEGEAGAMLSLGIHHEELGETTEAARWYEAAADHGSVLGAYVLGHMTWTGDGVTQDTERARSLFEVAAKGGQVEAMVALGVMAAAPEADDSGGKSSRLAEKWFLRAAELGNPDAMFNMGLLLQTDYGKGREEEALDWYRRAAEGGHPEAALLIPSGE